MQLLLTDRMRDKAAAPVLHSGEDVAGYQTGSRAAQDDIFPYQTLDVPEDALLDLKLLEHTLLNPRSFQEGITTQTNTNLKYCHANSSKREIIMNDFNFRSPYCELKPVCTLKALKVTICYPCWKAALVISSFYRVLFVKNVELQ